MSCEAVTSCHIRVAVSSRPKYRSVSRFSKTDSRSRIRTKTCAGTAPGSLNVSICTAPLEVPGLQVHDARGSFVQIAFYRASLRRNSDLRFLLPYVDFRLDARTERFQVRESLLCLLAPLPVW